MSSRTDQTYQLLRSLHDYLPTPKTWTGGLVQRSAQRGESPSKKIDCPRCNGTRNIQGRRGPEECPRCQGRGILVVDAYTGKAVGDTETGTVQTDDFWRRHQRRLHTDQQIERIEHDQQTRAGKLDPREAETWELTKAAYWRQGDYDALVRALRWLERELPMAHSALLRHVVYAQEAIVSERLQARMDEAVELLAARMPDKIRVPPWLHGKTHKPGKGRWANGHQRAERDNEIRRLRAQGWTVQRIAEHTGVDRSTVTRVCAKLHSDIQKAYGNNGNGEAA